jgi:hypothetical protein
MAANETLPPKLYTTKEALEWFPYSSVKTLQRLFSNRTRHPDVWHSREDTDIVIIGERRRAKKDHLGIPMHEIKRELAFGRSPAKCDTTRRMTPRKTTRKLVAVAKSNCYEGAVTVGRGDPASETRAA